MFALIIKRKTVIVSVSIILLLMCLISAPVAIFAGTDSVPEKKFIKWVDFSVTYEALRDAMEVDINSHTEVDRVPLNWVEILAYLGAKYGGDFKKYKKSDLTKLVETVKDGSQTIDALGQELSTYQYFKEAYGAVISGFLGKHSVERQNPDNPKETVMQERYGLKVYSPIAKGYSYSHFDDFGVSRSYGYRRKHLGHDMMGSVGTPIIAIESGVVECVGWNQYGGWRIGIRSFDKKRYYYYAHLRKDHPYNDVYEGKIVTAGDVIGYMGMTGYSTKENVNNINTPHLHYGLQLIFDEETQKDGTNQIWIDLYAITKLLEKNRSSVYRDGETKEYERQFNMFEENTED